MNVHDELNEQNAANVADLKARLERAERERDEAQGERDWIKERHGQQADRAEAAEARAQKAEAVVANARLVSQVLGPTPLLDAALAAYDEPPTAMRAMGDERA